MTVLLGAFTIPKHVCMGHGAANGFKAIDKEWITEEDCEAQEEQDKACRLMIDEMKAMLRADPDWGMCLGLSTSKRGNHLIDKVTGNRVTLLWPEQIDCKASIARTYLLPSQRTSEKFQISKGECYPTLNEDRCHIFTKKELTRNMEDILKAWLKWEKQGNYLGDFFMAGIDQEQIY